MLPRMWCTQACPYHDFHDRSVERDTRFDADVNSKQDTSPSWPVKSAAIALMPMSQSFSVWSPELRMGDKGIHERHSFSGCAARSSQRGSAMSTWRNAHPIGKTVLADPRAACLNYM